MTSPAEFPRLDLALVERGLADSRTRAARLIDSGDVQVDGRIISKAGFRVGPDSNIDVTALTRWVARSALKLLAACERFDIDYRGKTVLDIGASTGGFTEVALSRGAVRVVALDVGHDQLHPRIRDDYRVADEFCCVVGVVNEMVVHHLYGNLAIESKVRREINLGHSTSSDA
jgi:23S rRNA (cytidine1920-2'-O)/16S rRNA (cytidine1409-2'-O)-methyltransferase